MSTTEGDTMTDDQKPSRCRNCAACVASEDIGYCTEHSQRVRLNAVCPRHSRLVPQQRLFRATEEQEP